MLRTVISVVLFSTVYGNCPDGWVSFHNRCYLISSSYQSFGGALAVCKSLDASLVSIETDIEDKFLLSQVREKHEPKQSFWIGGNDLEKENNFKWIATGEAFNFTKWGNGQPDHQRYEDCVFMYMPNNGLWHDGLCQAFEHFICERENPQAINSGEFGEIIG